MPDQRYFFLAPLSNTAGHFRSIKLVSPFKVERWPKAKLVRMWRLLESLPKIEIEVRAESNHCFDRHSKVAHLITGSVDLPYFGTSSDKGLVEHHRTLDRALELLATDIRSLRLVLCAHIEMLGAYWYRLGGKPSPEMIASTVVQHPVDHGIGTINPNNITKLNAFIAERRKPIEREYLNIAWDHWDQSFGTYPEHRQFISLMTSLEAMFNVGQTDLKYRIARSMAVLLGDDAHESEYVFDSIKKAYDIRSRVIHTGKTDKLKDIWVWSLRRQVGNALQRLIDLDLDKEVVGEILTRLPFGAAATITQKSVSLLPDEERKWWK